MNRRTIFGRAFRKMVAAINAGHLYSRAPVRPVPCLTVIGPFHALEGEGIAFMAISVHLI